MTTNSPTYRYRGGIMNTRRKNDIWRFGLMLVLLCIWSMPQLVGAAPLAQIPTGPLDAYNGTPDYYTTANWANSPPMAKFVDALPGLGSAKANLLGQYLTVAKPDTITYPGTDYYEIELVEFRQRMHSDLPATTGPTTGATIGTLSRGYVQVNNGTNIAPGTLPSQGICGTIGSPVACVNNVTPDPVKYLGPTIISERDRPVRIKFTNRLPSGPAGDLFIPVDTSVMGSGTGPAILNGGRGEGLPCDNTPLNNSNGCSSYPQNRAVIHLHGGRTPWISDGTPHQWITPVEEITPFTKGVSFQNVPDMPDPGDGSQTYYYTNQQSARLMFYHDHAFGITRLNVYIGEAAGYLITDKYEQDLITRGLIPPDQIPLIIQDKTFVDASEIRKYDPLWNWGSGTPDGNGVRPPVEGDLWMPHVYMPAQNTLAGFGGVNPFGRWMYGPWFYPATAVEIGPKPNPYYDPNCSSTNPFILATCETPGQPEQIPGTPNVSMGMEAFQDSAVVNGTAFPSLTVDPRAYRFRILNAASDRFWNLSFYVADPAQISPDTRPASRLTEVKMVPASAELAAANNWPELWPVDGRDGGVPDPGVCTGTGDTLSCTNLGPNFLQIATEGGFLPQPVTIKPQPVTYITDPTAFWVGIVDRTGLALGPAERADVIVDFSAYAGKTLILYNDAPAAWPARVPGYDYFTGAPDMRDGGGYGAGGVLDPATGTWITDPNDPTNVPHGILPGYAPNTRTVMQVIVRATGSTVDGTYTFNQANLEKEFTAAAPVTAVNPAPVKTLFERSQEPIIVGQAAYSTAYPNSYFPTNYPWEGISQINDQYLNFVTLAGQQVTAPQHPKGIHDEMGASFDPIYGRMSGNLAMQLPNPTTLNALLILYGFSDLPTETVNNSNDVNVTVLGTRIPDPFLDDPVNNNRFDTNLGDGTQIWKISHNGVDTHPIHFHIFDVQLINRVGWDGQIAFPEPNELGWKDTVKISPLMDTIVAVRPRAPALPFGIPNSLRPLNPAIPIDSTMGFNSVDWKTGEARTPAVSNILYSFGWEYVWHCHILSHEEMDMMRPIVLNVVSELPPAFTATTDINGVNWTDPTPVTTIPANPEDYRNPANEVGYNVYRTAAGIFPVDGFGKPIPLNGSLYLRANTTSFPYPGASLDGETYVVEAFNAQGSTLAFVGTLFTATVATTNAGPYTSPGPVNLEATVSGMPTGVTISQVDFYNGATLIGTDTTAPYTLIWNSAPVGTNSITAQVSTNIPGGVIASAPLSVVVGGTLAADFTPADGATFNVCSNPITFTSTSTGAISGYSWMINGVNYTTNIVNPTLFAGVYPVTLGIINSATGEIAQATHTITVTNNAPTVTSTGGPYTVNPGGNLILNGTGTDADACDVLSYAWDVDNKNGYEFLTANPTISYNTLMTVLGIGTHTMNFKVTDPSGAFATAATTVTIAAAGAPAVMISPVNGTTFTGTSQTFVWSNIGATSYQLHIGTTGVGSANIGYFPNPASTATSVTVNGLPSNGSTIYVRLYSLISGAWKYNDYQYTAYNNMATMLPSVPATFTGTSQLFSWTNTGATAYQIHVGTTGAGSYNIGFFPNPASTATSVTVNGLPSNGSTVYVRLYTLISGAWKYNDYQYTAFNSKATMLPSVPATISGGSQLFEWTNTGATSYQLHIGTGGAGTANIGYFPNPATNATSVNVTGLPTAGSIYVRLYSLVSGSWKYNDYVYAATP